MLEDQVVFNAVEIGDKLPEIKKEPTTVQLFRYSAVTWNTHRIHFDKDYAVEEGYPHILVQSHLHGAFLTQLCTDWMGTQGELKSLEVIVKRYATSGDTLTCKGTVIEKNEINGEHLVTIEVEEVNQRGELCALGKAFIKLPLE